MKWVWIKFHYMKWVWTSTSPTPVVTSLFFNIKFTEWGRIWATFTNFHQLSPTFTNFHHFSPFFTNFHQLSPTFTNFHQLSPTLCKFGQVRRSLTPPLVASLISSSGNFGQDLVSLVQVLASTSLITTLSFNIKFSSSFIKFGQV